MAKNAKHVKGRAQSIIARNQATTSRPRTGGQGRSLHPTMTFQPRPGDADYQIPGSAHYSGDDLRGDLVRLASEMQPLIREAKKLPKPLNSTLSEALEQKYALAAWCYSDGGRMAMAELSNWTSPNIEGSFASEKFTQIATAMFVDTCLHGPLYYCTPTITRTVWEAAEQLEDWTLTEDLILPSHGMFFWFGEALPVMVLGMPKVTQIPGLDPNAARPMELRGILLSTVFVGAHHDEPQANGTSRVEYVENVRYFSKNVKSYNRVAHVSALIGVPGMGIFTLPMSLVGWQMGISSRQQREGYDYTAPSGTPAWREEDEMTSKMLGALLIWIKDRILVHTPGRADRAARRRIGDALPLGQQGWKPNPEPDIRIVELRAKDYITPPRDDDREAVEWHYRWVVRGHWRQQRCGPARSQIRPTWIAPYLKGPEGLPLKTPKPTVFAVTR